MAFSTRRLLGIALLAMAGLGCGDFSGSSDGAVSGPQQLLSNTGDAGGIEAFRTTLKPVVQANCLECHDGGGPGAPHFAAPNDTQAYQAAIIVADLAAPPLSRMVGYVGGGHECFDPSGLGGPADCVGSAAALEAAIVAWADAIDFGEGGVSISETLASGSLTLGDGLQDVGSERYSQNLVAFYEFKEGSGPTAFDTSGVAPAIDLQLEGNAQWMSAYGVQISPAEDGLGAGRLRSESAPASKLYDMIASPQSGTGQYTVEAWITNANITQEGPARIVTYSQSGGRRNFTLGQKQYQYSFRNRAVIDVESNVLNGLPALETYDMDEDAQASLQHVVLTYDPFRGRRVYVDGSWTDDVDEAPVGHLWNWQRDGGYRLGMGAEMNSDPSNDTRWEGQVRLVAIYNQALTDAQIQANYQAGVGKRLLMRFDISQWTAPGSFVEFVVSEFDNYSYLFCTPTYRSANPTAFRLANIRVAVNGTVATTGQGFYTLDTQIVSGQQELSRQCAVIPKGPGPDPDVFTLVFEHLNGFLNLIVEADPPDLDVLTDDQGRPIHGMRDFERVSQSMATVTGVSALTDGPRQVAAELQQQLPGGSDLRGFVSSQQVGISKLALEYCDVLVERDLAEPNTANRFFGTFPFGTPTVTALAAGSPNRDLVTNALYDAMVGDDELVDQPDLVDVQTDMDPLYDALVAANPATSSAVKGACAAVLASAAISIH
jgi:hypothetical protein